MTNQNGLTTENSNLKNSKYFPLLSMGIAFETQIETMASSWDLTLVEVPLLYWKLGVNRSITYKTFEIISQDFNIFLLQNNLLWCLKSIYSKISIKA